MTSIEHMFETRSVSEIQEISKRLEFDCQRKTTNLREVVNDRYKDVIESLDIVRNMQVQCKSSLDSLLELEEYLSKWNPLSIEEERSKFVRNDASEESNDVKHGRIMSSLLDAPSKIYESLEGSDYPLAISVYQKSIEAAESFLKSSINLPIKNFDLLLREILSSLSRCKDFIEFTATDELQHTPDNLQRVNHCLAALAVVNKLNPEEVLQRFLSMNADAIDEIISSKHTITEFLPSIFKILYSVVRVTSEAFVLGGLSDTLFKEYQVSQEVNISSISILIRKWFSDRLEEVKNLLPSLLKKTKTVSGMFEGLSNVNSLKMSKWNFYCSKTIDSVPNPWGDVLRQPCLDFYNQEIFKQIETIFSDLAASKVRDVNVQVSSFVWTDSDTDFRLKKKALISGFSQTMTSLSSRFLSLFSEVEPLLKPDNLSFVYDQDILEMRTTVVYKIQDRFQTLLDQFEQTVKKHPSKVLSLSFLTRSLAIDCESLQKIFTLGVKENEFSDLSNEMLSRSQNWLCLHYNQRIETFSIQLLKLSESSVEQIMEGSLNWHEVALAQDTGPSFIRVPIFPSQQLTDFLTLVSQEVNTISGHGAGDHLCSEIVVKMSKEILRVYRETYERLSSSKLPESVKQKKAIQCYFDLHFLRSLVKYVKEDRIRDANSGAVGQLNHAVKSFESLLDPFDLHLMTPRIQSYVANSIRTTLQMTSLFLPQDCVYALKKMSEPKDSVMRQDIGLIRPSNTQLELLSLETIPDKK